MCLWLSPSLPSFFFFHLVRTTSYVPQSGDCQSVRTNEKEKKKRNLHSNFWTHRHFVAAYQKRPVSGSTSWRNASRSLWLSTSWRLAFPSFFLFLFPGSQESVCVREIRKRIRKKDSQENGRNVRSTQFHCLAAMSWECKFLYSFTFLFFGRRIAGHVVLACQEKNVKEEELTR